MNDSIDIRRLRPGGSQPANLAGAGPNRTQPANVGGAAPKDGNTDRGGGRIWAFLNKDIRLFGNGLPDKIKESFYLELSVLLSAGIDIRAALDLIKSEQPKKKHQQIFDHIVRQIVAGSTLSAAMKSNGLFTPYEYYSVQIGEETGKLIIVLNELATYYKKKIDQQRQIVSALTYPVLVMLVAGGAVRFYDGLCGAYVRRRAQEVRRRSAIDYQDGYAPFRTHQTIRGDLPAPDRSNNDIYPFTKETALVPKIFLGIDPPHSGGRRSYP